MKAEEIRAKFLEFFKENDHSVVKSSSLVPKDDPTLLFTNAGMVQFKRAFLDEEKRPYKRAATSQKCVRAGGKHNDLENVGYTNRHHTFFEMLGNFSFGDYFKALAIELGWKLLVEDFALPPEKLIVTIYKDDDEAEDLWKKIVGLPGEKILRFGEEDNFWSMGETGPCGPCSEIHYDQGEDAGCGQPDCSPACECDRYLELWNLVFMQFNRDQTGSMTPLPKPSIDTGMGLERIASVVQGYRSNYESDLFRPLISFIEELSGVRYVYQAELNSKPGSRSPRKTNVSTRVIADHARSLSFLIGDGVLPENVGRGYVLRRILRRGVRHGRNLGLKKPFLHQVAGKVIEQMGSAYPELKNGASYIQKVILSEEERFSETLDNGLKLLSDETDRLRETGDKTLSGEVAFKLYDTYGFPLDLVEDVCRENGLTVDIPGFEAAMERQRSKSRASWKGSGEAETPEPISSLAAAGFKVEAMAHEGISAESELVLIMKEGLKTDQAQTGEKVELVFKTTPFYGEAGGQVGDTGRIRNPEAEVHVTNTIAYPGGIVVHQGLVESGSIKTGRTFRLLVTESLRRDTARNHTATHLLHAVLRQELGDHVKQAGSRVSPNRLRFDFTHFIQVTPEELDRIERKVNEKIRENLPVLTTIMSMEEAMQTGAVALFEERYGDTVRVVNVPDFSMELCGGTHTERTGDIGLFVIMAESSAAAGVRRLEALTGRAAIETLQAQRETLRGVSATLKTTPEEVPERLAKLQSRQKELERELDVMKQKMSLGRFGDIMDQVQEVAGVHLLAARVHVDNPKNLREIGDNLKDKLKSGVIVLAAENKGKALLLAIVTPDLQDRFHAGNMIKDLAQVVGGKGGGRPDMAQAGGPKPENIDQALSKAQEVLAKQ
ncbi:MAG: alanine--tRNA ligase [Deltaproteobacteria bacterium]|nr:alanine--tRNA ligase [Deltaproteobacteria bacterium]MBW2139730.1 alanine--tRNA ligase [Deltaproteobacteria bacterium]